jgi:hypothetical protein
MKSMLKVSEYENGIRFEVKVQPRASQNQITGAVEGVMKVRLNSPPVDGKANQALINLLSKTFNVPKKSITIVRGETSTSKLIQIAGLNKETFIKQAGI